MKIAVFSDIHGNDIAFAAAARQARNQGATRFIIAGDLVTDFPMSNEVIDRARNLTKLVVQGNREQYLIDYDQHHYHHWHEYIQFRPLLWTYSQLKSENLQYLKSLPETLTIPLDRENDLYVVHKLPRTRYDPQSIDQYREAGRNYFLRFPAHYRVFCTGHTHVSSIEEIEGRLLINAGSVGGNFAGGFQAEYVLLNWENGFATAEVHYARYDEQTYIRQLQESKLLDDEALKHWMQFLYLSTKDGCNYLLDFFIEADRLKAARAIESPYLTDAVWRETIKNFISKGILKL